MRRKISKRKRRDILRKGGVFVQEEWLYEIIDGRKEKIGFTAHVYYLGWKIHGCGRDELEAYRNVIDTMPWCEENPRNDINSYISIANSERPIPVTGVWSLWER